MNVNAADLAAGLSIALGGPLDPTLMAQLVEVRVETTTALPDVCTLRFTEADLAGSGDLKIIDDARFKLGAPLSVKLAAPVGTGGLQPVFDGEVTTVEAELGPRPGGDPVLQLVVTGHDRSHRLHRRTTTRTFRQMTAEDVAKKVAGEHGLKVGKLAKLPGGPAEVLHQVGESDWAFLSRHVADHGGELDIAGGALHIIDPTKTAREVAELVWGETLERFRPRVSSVGQVATVAVAGWDPKSKRDLNASAKPKASTTTENSSVDATTTGTRVLVTTAPVSTQAEVAAAADAIAARLGHERVQGEATAVGNPLLLAGEYVKISGVGKRFGGVHRIVSAVHVYGAAGYKTRLVLGGGGRPLAQTVNGNGRHAAGGFADHLAIGIVTSNDDPDKLARIKVRYPAFGQEVESGWARVAREASGNARGTVALPHVGDEVVVGFQHGDIRRPFVLGSLFNGVDKPGADLVKTTSSVAARYPRDLDVKTEGQTLLEAAKAISVKSAQDTVEVSAGKDMKLTAGAAGAGTVTIETTGQIKMNGKQGIEIVANGPLKISSTAPVTVESQAALQLKGTAIQVQASGVLQLSGATVMIG